MILEWWVRIGEEPKVPHHTSISHDLYPDIPTTSKSDNKKESIFIITDKQDARSVI